MAVATVMVAIPSSFGSVVGAGIGSLPPSRSTVMDGFSTVGNGKGRQRRKSGDGLINLLTPRRKRSPVTGSYSVQGAVGRPRREAMSSSSFRRQNSQPTTPLAPPRSSLLSPSHLSCPAVLSPCRERLPSPAQVTTPNSQASEVRIAGMEY